MNALVGFGLLVAGTIVFFLPERFVRGKEWQYDVLVGRLGGHILVRLVVVLVGVALAVSGVVVLVRLG